ncbi:MAG: lipoate--protein ligase family protein [Bacteriovoracaceae bacterium]|nr:lipoate--protein ligase family protein [Bacteriovoracaceae bacterium]
MAVYFYHSSSHDALSNLALELSLLRGKLPDDATDILLSYENSPSIIIGRFQNPWLECNIPKVNELKIPIYRRVSGGGTVYHDFGNLNFSIISKRPHYQRSDSLRIMIDTLATFNKQVTENDRFDLYFEGKKISGSAMRKTKDRFLHHFTLLGNLNYSTIAELLHTKYVDRNNVSSLKAGNAIPSVAATTTSLFPKNEWDIEKIKMIKEQFCVLFSQTLNSQVKLLENIPDDRKEKDELSSLLWRYSETPPFEQMINLSEYDSLVLSMEKGKIVKIEKMSRESSKREVILKDFPEFSFYFSQKNDSFISFLRNSDFGRKTSVNIDQIIKRISQNVIENII